MSDLFTEGAAEAFDLFSRGIGAAINRRFRMQEYENFKANEAARFNQVMQNAVQMMSDNPDDKDIQVQAFMNYKQGLNDFLLAPGNYPGNEMVAAAAKGMFEGNVGLMDEFMGFERETEERGEGEADLRAEGRELEVSKARQAQATDRARELYLGRLPASGASQKGEDIFSDVTDWTNVNQLEKAFQKESGFRLQAKALETVEGQMAQEKLEALRGQPGGSTGLAGYKWGMHPDDTKAAKALLDPEEKEVRMKRKILMERGLTPEALEAGYGGKYSLKKFELKPLDIVPSTGTLTPGETLLKVWGFPAAQEILDVEGEPGKTDQTAFTGFTNKDFIKGLPKKLKQLPAGPMTSVFNSMTAFNIPEGGRGFNPRTKEPWVNWGEVEMYYEAEAKAKIRKAIGGKEFTNEQLSGMKQGPTLQTRKLAFKQTQMAFMKYAEELSGLIGVPIPSAKKKAYRDAQEKGIFGKYVPEKLRKPTEEILRKATTKGERTEAATDVLGLLKKAGKGAVEAGKGAVEAATSPFEPGP
jgi:hypothetical protein